LAAILVAMELGMNMKEIVKTINEIEFVVPYLNIYKGINKSRILDDGYNVNPTAFIAAINYLDSLKIKSTKWIMTQGMIELGDEKKQIYRKIAQLIVKKVDGLYTSDRYLLEEVKNLNPEFKGVLVNSVFDFPIYYKYVVKENDIVLLEGPFPQIVLDKIYLGSRL
jgi:UDP-N-acetylmuramyl pentapeptide synthase